MATPHISLISGTTLHKTKTRDPIGHLHAVEFVDMGNNGIRLLHKYGPNLTTDRDVVYHDVSAALRGDMLRIRFSRSEGYGPSYDKRSGRVALMAAFDEVAKSMGFDPTKRHPSADTKRDTGFSFVDYTKRV